jgi:hypothetical protein
MSMLRVVRRYRTMALGLIALACLVVSAVYSFDVDVRELLGFLGMSLLLLLSVILAAAIFAALFLGLSRLLRRRGNGS